MKGKQKITQHAARLLVLIVFAGTIFSAGLRSFIPEDRKGQTYTLMIFRYLKPAQDIHPAVLLVVNNWRSYGEAIYRRRAL